VPVKTPVATESAPQMYVNQIQDYIVREREILIIKPTRCTNFWNLFLK